MKTKEKVVIIGLLILTSILIGIFLIRSKDNKQNNEQPNAQENKLEENYSQVLEDGTKLNTSSKLKETKKIDSLEISDIQLTNKNEQSVLLANVTNKGNKKTQAILLDIILYNKAGEEIATIPGVISPLEPGKTTQLNTVVQEDYTNVYDFKVVKK